MWAQISTGVGHSCALSLAGQVKCWGGGLLGQLGNGTRGRIAHPVTVINGEGSSIPLSGIRQIAAGFGHTCAVTQGGQVKCWGTQSYGRLGNGDDIQLVLLYPVTVIEGEGSSTPLTGVVQVGIGHTHTCALLSNGQVKCWGEGEYGQLGYGSTANVSYPVDVLSEEGSSDNL